jgi:hypothetical protein
MQAYKFDTTISKEGTITIPFEPVLFNRDAEVIIIPKKKTIRNKKKYSASDFLKDWTGILENMPEEKTDKIKYEYLIQKHK